MFLSRLFIFGFAERGGSRHQLLANAVIAASRVGS
jgi:hypothetical protein